MRSILLESYGQNSSPPLKDLTLQWGIDMLPGGQWREGGAGSIEEGHPTQPGVLGTSQRQ